MAQPFVQGTGIASSGSVASVSKAFANSVLSGNIIAVGAVANADTLTTSSVTDSLGNSYTRVVFVNGVAAGRAESAIYLAYNVVAGPCTVTLDPTGSDFVSLVIAEFSAQVATDPQDGSGTLNAGVSSATTSTFTMAFNGVVFGVLEQNDAGTTISEAQTLIFEDENATNAMPINGQYEIVTAGSGKSASWTLGVSSSVTACALGIRSALVQVRTSEFTRFPKPKLSRLYP